MIFSVFLLAATSFVTNATALAHDTRPDVRFEITGTVTYTNNEFAGEFAIEDASGAVALQNETRSPYVQLSAGDRVRARGRTAFAGNGGIRLNCTHIDVLGHGPAPEPHTVAIRDIADGKCDARHVRTTGVLRDVYVDEIDPRFLFLVFSSEGESVHTPRQFSDESLRHYRQLVGATMKLTGLCVYCHGGERRHEGRAILLHDESQLKVLKPAPSDLFDVPGIGDLDRLEPSRIARHGRCRAVGTVIAVWNGNRALVKDNGGRLIGLVLAEGEKARTGEVIEATGFPASDLYRINLLRTRIRPALGHPLVRELPEPVTAADILTDNQGNKRYATRWHGRTIRITGSIKAISTPESGENRIYLESDTFVIPIDISTIPDVRMHLAIGSTVTITGICILEAENWTPYSAFPQITGITVATRAPDDIAVLSRPSWWTPMRLLTAIVGLLLGLTAIIVWNLLLRKTVARREKALKQEIFAHVDSNAKVRERTRLAVELHDSLSQGLTGVSMEIDAALRLKDDPEKLAPHLSYAAKSLMSCRNELKNCIWDLRNDMLGNEDLDEAIRRMLAPVLSGATLSLRFAVPRAELTDNQAHTILRIIRELVTNAIRHGRARTIRIAGSTDGSRVYCSVRDDGCGFDPDRRPGIAEGHFGLQGIHERLKESEGELDIVSACGRGTRVEFSLKLSPHE